jgi:hypothetical protein
MRSNEDAARFVDAILQCSVTDLVSITITKQATSGGCCVSIATDTLSEDTVKTLGRIYLEELMSI